MARKFVSRFHLPGPLLGMQSDIQRFADSVTDSDITDGVLIEDIDLRSGQDNVIGHSLNRPITGYIPVRLSANSVVFDATGAGGNLSREFKVRCSADVTVTFWVF
tara:strand:- start:4425 stop:4739 length:315 start_codon:yes stop_codon:yes gene_type:complete